MLVFLLTSYLLLRSASALTFSSIATTIYPESDGSTYHVHVFSLDSNGNLYLDAWLNGGWRNTLIIPLSTSTIPNSPIAAASWTNGTNGNIRVYYLTDENILMEAGGSCVISSCSYTWIEDAVLVGQKVQTSSNSALAAAYVQGGDEQGGLRVFYRDSTSRVTELACEFRGKCWFTSPQTLNADKSSSLTAAARNDGGLQVYFVLNGKIAGAIQGSDANDSWTTISGPPNADISFNPALPLSFVTGPAAHYDRLYYVDASKTIKEWLFNDTADCWAQSPSLLGFTNADAPANPIAAVGWNISVRVYYSTGGTLIAQSLEQGQGSWQVGKLKQMNPADTASVAFSATSASGPGPTQSDSSSPGGWNGLTEGQRIGIIAGIIGAIVTAITSIWGCVFGFYTWRRRSRGFQ